MESTVPTKYWHQLDDGRVQCDLCPRFCRLRDGQRGMCFVRMSQDNQIVLTTYGRSSGFCIDPIEKKPLYHFYPGTGAFSMGFAGCNLQCLNCQNWELSQKKPEELQKYSLFPDQAVKAAEKSSCKSIAYTYNEPSVIYEFMLDTSRMARSKNIKNVWVTNGYINKQPLLEFCKTLDGANVDLKSFWKTTQSPAPNSPFPSGKCMVGFLSMIRSVSCTSYSQGNLDSAISQIDQDSAFGCSFSDGY